MSTVSHKDELFRLLVSNVTDYAIFALDVKGTIVTWNEGAKRITGFQEQEIVGRHLSVFYSEEDIRAGIPFKELEIAQQEGRFEAEGWRYRKDATPFWANVVITPIYDEQGALISYAKIIRDLSERVRAEEKLRRSEEVFRAMVQSIKEYAIFLLDKDGTVLTWNEGARRIKGYEAADVIGKSFELFYPQEARDREHPKFELEIAKRTGHYEEEGWRVRKDGTQLWASVTITAVYDEEQKLRGFVKVTRDLTERRENEMRLRQARDEALTASLLKSQFVANVSHEVRTPLAGIIGMAEILQEDEELNDEQREAAQHIFMSSQRLLQVLNDILDFSKLEAGRTLVQEERFSPRVLIREVVDSISAPASKKGLRIESKVDDEVPEFVIGDEGLIRQCLMNFAHNAVKFTQTGFVKLETWSEPGSGNDYVELGFNIKDSGIGIDPAMEDRLFKPFVQADGSDRRKFAGTGLGLSISKGNIELMHGDCGYTSAPGEGTTFWFHVPVKLQR